MAPKSNKKTKAAKKTTARASESKVTVQRPEEKKSGNFLDKIQTDLEKNQSYLNLILGALIVIVLGVLVFNYFNKPSDDTGNITPASEQTMTDENGDVTKEGLPGKYKVKEGDTLFLIADKYYGDGNKYSEIVKENSLQSESIEVGQELNIPKLEAAEPSQSPEASASDSAEPSSSPEASMEPSATPSPTPSEAPSEQAAPEGEKGAMMNQSWGEPIKGDSYTVVKGDWLSTISARAYGDMMKFDKIAQANNISNPNSIEVGTVLKIPRD